MLHGHQGMPGMGTQDLSLSHLCIRILALAHTWISSPVSVKLAPPFTLPPHHDKQPLTALADPLCRAWAVAVPIPATSRSPTRLPPCTPTRTEAFMIALQCRGVVVV